MAIIRANNNTISAVTALPAAITTGGLVKISTTTVSSAVSSVAFPTIGTDYKFYKLIFNDLHASANDLFQLRFTANNGTAYLSGSTYDYCSQNSTNSSNTQYASNAASSIKFGYWNMSTYSGHASHGEITFSNLAHTQYYPSIYWIWKYTDTSNLPVRSYGTGHYRANGAMTGFHIIPGSGNIETGTFTLYGMVS